MKHLLIIVAIAASTFVAPVEHHEDVAHAEEHQTCKSEYPHYLTSAPRGYKFTSEDAAFRAAKSKHKRKIRKGKRDRATRGPCADEKRGTHVNLRFVDDGSDRAGSLVGCPICREKSGKPEVYWRWKFIP